MPHVQSRADTPDSGRADVRRELILTPLRTHRSVRRASLLGLGRPPPLGFSLRSRRCPTEGRDTDDASASWHKDAHPCDTRPRTGPRDQAKNRTSHADRSRDRP